MIASYPSGNILGVCSRAVLARQTTPSCFDKVF